MCLAAAQHVIDRDRFAEFGIPAAAEPAIRTAWDAEPPSIYGRFDLAYDGLNLPKMLEYYADTPASLVEVAVIQWNWLKSAMRPS
jgi:glutathionylspermidine synthase